MASVLITGCSKGIGKETALAFARAGYRVHATMRNPEQGAELGAAAAHEKLDLDVWPMDVDSDESVKNTIAAIQQADGPIDVLVNNAGLDVAGAVEEVPLERFRAAMETNYFGALRTIQAVITQMRERRSGCIINVSSVAGRISNPPMTPYCASKWALEALSEGLAGEMKTFGVRVALVEPGVIDTSMARRLSGAAPESPYRQLARFAVVFSEVLKDPVPPSVVAAKILEVAESGTWQLRHLAGPGAGPILERRRLMTDEEWIDHHASDDATYFRQLSGSK